MNIQKKKIWKERFKRWSHKGEQGGIAVFFAVLFPVLMTTIIFFENRMEVRYVTIETQAILDLATTGASTTGIIYQTNDSKPFCSIPYNSSTKANGKDVAETLLRSNAGNLPSNAKAALLTQMTSGEIQGLDDEEEYNGGYSRLYVTYEYAPRTELFFNKYKISLKSSATCYPDPDLNLNSGSANKTYIFYILQENGYSPEAAASVVGNLVGESGGNINPAAVESNGEGFGIAQWSFGRKTRVKQWLAANGYSETSLEGQVKFMMQELDEYGIGDLKTSTDVTTVVTWLINNYERPREDLRPARVVLGVNTANSLLASSGS